MKMPDKSKEKKGKVKLKQIPKGKKEQVLIVAQEIKFARLLSGNEKKTRDRVVKSLKKWLYNCFEKGYEFKEDDFNRVWKGLFYAVWMSDKPLIQEELCDNIAEILDVFPEDQVKHAVLMTKAGFKVLATEWYGIDHHRMDKFLMLVRRYLRGSLRVLLRSKWTLKSCQIYSKMLSSTDGIFAVKTPHYARNALSLQLHIVDCYLEELSKVSNGDIPDASLVELLKPFFTYMCGGEAPALCSASRRVLTALVRQSEPGLKYQHATLAWKQMGCPEGGPDALQLVSDDEEENGDEGSEDGGDGDSPSKPLDPRAGRVDVELPVLPVPAALIVQQLRTLLPTVGSKAHKRLKICIERFEQLSRDQYPLRIRCPSPVVEEVVASAKESAQSLHTLEKKLVAASDELALRGLSRKHRKRLLARSRAGASIVEDLDKIKQTTNATNGDWQVESTEPVAKKPKQDTSNKENQNKNKRKRDASEKQATNKRKANIDATNMRHKLDTTDQNKKNRDKIVENGVNKNNKIVASDKSSKKLANKVKNVTVNVNNVSTTKKVKEDKVPVKKNSKNNVENCKSNADNVTTNVKTGKKQENKAKNETKTVLTESAKKCENKIKNKEKTTKASVVVNKVKHFQKQSKKFEGMEKKFTSPKKVQFVLKNNSMQGPVDYYKSVRQSPSIPFDGAKKPSKTNLKPSTPSPINPFLKKKLKLK